MAHYKDTYNTCEACGNEANVSTWKRDIRDGVIVKGPRRDYCYDCYDAMNYPRPINRELKNLKRLVADLREHAYNYLLDDGQLSADLHQAANYLEAVANG
jgi:hypothetical protein